MARLRLHFPEHRHDALDDGVRRQLVTVADAVLAAYPLQGPVDVILTDDARLRLLNDRYLGKDRPTDVLSFPLGEGQPLVTVDAAGQIAAAAQTGGEIYVSLDRARTQATEIDVPLGVELARLIVHGLLHLAGYNHDTEDALRIMEDETQRFVDLMYRAPDSCPGGQPI